MFCRALRTRPPIRKHKKPGRFLAKPPLSFVIFKHLPSVIPKLFPIAERYLLFLTFLRLIVGQITLRSAFVSFTDSPFSPLNQLESRSLKSSSTNFCVFL